MIKAQNLKNEQLCLKTQVKTGRPNLEEKTLRKLKVGKIVFNFMTESINVRENGVQGPKLKTQLLFLFILNWGDMNQK